MAPCNMTDDEFAALARRLHDKMVQGWIDFGNAFARGPAGNEAEECPVPGGNPSKSPGTAPEWFPAPLPMLPAI